VSINGLHVRGSSHRVVVFRKYQALNLPEKVFNINGRPHGIAVGRYGVWTVAEYCVYVFDSKDQLVKKVGSHGKNVGQSSWSCT